MYFTRDAFLKSVSHYKHMHNLKNDQKKSQALEPNLKNWRHKSQAWAFRTYHMYGQDSARIELYCTG